MVSLKSNLDLKTDKTFMLEAFSVALKCNSDVYPNPKVGCVIVKNNKIISRGWTSKFGSNHAEKNALKSIDKDVKDLTMYVTMEPCHHHGKTPPCTDLINPNQFIRVVIAEKDPFVTAGGGAEFLKKLNIEVEVGLCKDEARKLNEKFYVFHEKKRPYVILKYASSLDGYIALKNGQSKWITNENSRSLNHKTRSECDAILVGRKTIQLDDPSLTSHGKGKDPIIIVIDNEQKIDKKSQIFNKNQKVIIFSDKELKKSPKNNIEVILNKLYKMKIQSVLVEGGGSTITSFLESGLFDELNVYIAPKFFGEGIPLFQSEGDNKNSYNLKLDHVESIRNDIKIIYKRED
tara:strand:- start:964 stop:2004 length:1041 start_codon:yes stop_codon:yes gene_type:complete